MIRNGIKAISFILVCLLVLGGVNSVLRFKYNDGIEEMETFYEQPDNSVDVLFLGSSHIDANVNPGVLWDSRGIASYNMSGSMQPLWNTYYCMKEALKTQTPKVVVVDVFRVLEEQEYMDQSRVIKNTFGMEEGENKLEAKRVSASADELMEYILEFPHYHRRYSDLTREDFLDHKGIKDQPAWKGFGINFTSASLPEDTDVSDIAERSPLPEKAEDYLYRIISLSKNSNIPLVLVCAPYALSDGDQQKYNTVADIAEREGIPFLNYNLMHEESGIDFSGPDSCLASDRSHLNHRGNVKYTEHLGAWLTEHYDIPDRRGDSDYSSWQVSANNIRASYENHEIAEIPQLSDWLNAIEPYDRLTVVMVFDHAYSSGNGFDKEVESLQRFGVESSSLHDEAVLVLKDSKQEFFSTDSTYRWYEKTYSSTLMVERSSKNTIIELGYDDYQVQKNGITVLLYDELTDKIVESAWWSADSYSIKNANSAL